MPRAKFGETGEVPSGFSCPPKTELILNGCREPAEEVLAGCRERSLKHQEKLYKQYYGYVMAIGLSYAAEREEAKEITNDTFLKVFESIDRYDPYQPFKSWLRKIAVNTAIDHYRKSKRRNCHTELNDVTQPVVVCDSIHTLTVEEIYDLIKRLPNTLRMVFNLHEIEGYRHWEIAHVMNISESSSRTYLMRAKERLRALMEINFYRENGKSV